MVEWHSSLWETYFRMGSHIVSCYLILVNALCLSLSQTGRYSIYLLYCNFRVKTL